MTKAKAKWNGNVFRLLLKHGFHRIAFVHDKDARHKGLAKRGDPLCTQHSGSPPSSTNKSSPPPPPPPSLCPLRCQQCLPCGSTFPFFHCTVGFAGIIGIRSVVVRRPSDSIKTLHLRYHPHLPKVVVVGRGSSRFMLDDAQLC